MGIHDASGYNWKRKSETSILSPCKIIYKKHLLLTHAVLWIPATVFGLVSNGASTSNIMEVAHYLRRALLFNSQLHCKVKCAV